MTAIITTGAFSTASTFTKVYDSNDASDFNGSKTLAQIGITATDSVAIVGGKLQLGPTFLASGYAHNRATFAPSMKYGRIIAEFTVPPAGTACGVFAGQQGGFDYFGYALSAIYANLLGTTGTDANRNLANNPATVPPSGNLCRLTLDLLPDIDNTRRVVFRTDDLTAGTNFSASTYADCTIPNLAGTFGVFNQSPSPQSAGAAFTRVAIYSLDGAADLPPASGVKNIVAIGDSITQGTGSGGTFDMSGADFSYPSQLSRLFDGTYEVVNKGHSGLTATSLLAYFPTDVSPLYSTVFSKNVAVILVGANDIGQTTDTAATIYGRIVALHNAARAQGFLTIAVAPYRVGFYPAGYPRSVVVGGGGAATDYNATVDGVVSLMVAGWRSFADGFVNPGTDARFNVPSTNPLLGDQLHPNPSGYTFLAGLVNTAVRALPPAPFLYALDSLALLAQPTHAVYVLEGPLTLTYRNATYTVPTGVSVNVPMSIYDLLRLDGFIA